MLGYIIADRMHEWNVHDAPKSAQNDPKNDLKTVQEYAFSFLVYERNS